MWIFISVIVMAIVVGIIAVVGIIVIVNMWLQWKQYKKSEIEQGCFGYANKYDAYTKCVKVINSCETAKQKINANNMVKAFINLYNDSDLNEMLWDEFSYKLYR